MPISNAEQIQVLYEIAFGFDNQDSIKNNLRKALSTILRRMNCSGGSIILKETDSNSNRYFEHFFSIPKYIEKQSMYDEIITSLNNEYENSDGVTFYDNMPKIFRKENEDTYFVLGLSDFGLMILVKRESENTKHIIKSLKPVLEKIGENCINIIKSEELERSRKRLKSFYTNVPTALYRSDFKGNFTMMNPACREMIGISKNDNIKSYNIKDLYCDINDRKYFLEQFDDKSVLNNYEIYLKKKNGQKFLAKVNTNAFRDENNDILYFEGNIEDITSQKELEDKLLYAKESAERSERLQSEFLAQISHEIRTPINSILNFSSILRDEYRNTKTENSEYSFNVIENSAHRLLRTIDLVLNLTEVESGIYDVHFEHFNLENDLIKPLLAEFIPIAKSKGLELFYVNNSIGELDYKCDKYTTTQIFVNLINNAIKYTQEGKVELSTERKNGAILLSLKDTGIGMSEEYLPNIFDKFTQEEGGYTRKYEGNGLGLALVKKYCELNNIKISVDSKKGIGTTFLLELLKENHS